MLWEQVCSYRNLPSLLQTLHQPFIIPHTLQRSALVLHKWRSPMQEVCKPGWPEQHMRGGPLPVLTSPHAMAQRWAGQVLPRSELKIDQK